MVLGLDREDEAGTALSVREHREAARPIVAGQGGRIVKTMGAPILTVVGATITIIHGL